MDLIEILAATLRRGCGVELDELVSSEEFLSKVSVRAAWYEQLSSEDSDLGVAYRAGHLEMGALLNVLPEELAIQQADSGIPPDPYLSVLLEMVGEELLKAATKCLPLNVKSSSVLYLGSDGDAQIRLINAAYKWLDAAYDAGRKLEKETLTEEFNDDTVLFQLDIRNSTSKVVITKRIARKIANYYTVVGREDDAQKVADLLEFVLKVREGGEKSELDSVAANLVIDYFMSHAAELAQEDWMRQFTEDDYSSKRVLPMEYGKLGVAPGVPCCLGMSLMLSAFARLTGLPVMLVNPLSSNLDREYVVSKAYSEAVIDHLVATKSSNTTYREALQRQVDIASGIAGRVQDFHYSIAMQVADGRWVQLDPYLNTWGVYGDEWELDRIYSLLTKYKDVLPGLTLVGGNERESVKWEGEWRDRVDHAITVAEHVLMMLGEMPFEIDTQQDGAEEDRVLAYGNPEPSVFWIARVLEEASDLFDLAFEVFMLQGRDLNEELYQVLGLLGMTEVTKLIFAGHKRSEFEGDTDLLFDRFTILFNDDPEFQLKMIEKLITNIVDWVIEQWRENISKPSSRMLDPTMQFSLPEYNLGLAVTSHVRSWTYPDIPGRLLVGLSSSQILWHEAVDLSRGVDQSDMDHPDVIRAETMVRALPHHHAACDHKLRYIAELRQERTRNGKESQSGASC